MVFLNGTKIFRCCGRLLRVAFYLKSKYQRLINLRAYNLQLLWKGTDLSIVSMYPVAQKLQIWGFLHYKRGLKQLGKRDPRVCSQLWSLKWGPKINWFAVYCFEITSLDLVYSSFLCILPHSSKDLRHLSWTKDIKFPFYCDSINSFIKITIHFWFQKILLPGFLFP